MEHSFEKQSGKTKEYILECAIDLFSEKGYKEVTVREIADKVGIKASSLYKHYKSKEEILENIFSLFRIMDQSAEYDDEMLRSTESMTPESFLASSFMVFKALVLDPRVLKITKIINLEQTKNAMVKEFFMKEIVQKPITQLTLTFEKMMKAGLIKPSDPEMLAKTYHSYIISSYYLNNFIKDAIDIPEIEKDMLDYIHFFCECIL